MSTPFRFPEDLITLQRAWQQTYAELAQLPAGASTTALRGRLIALSAHLCTHPYWSVKSFRSAAASSVQCAARRALTSLG
ncbi:hypothetical protein [Streptomyces sp. NPDC127112]|uniref:hypothetical protein n=1 Tax=Streptomyces sp. NPDC127112 TaxID=3345364 RepID=UPI0036358A79